MATPSTVIELSEYHHMGYLIRVSDNRRTLDLRCRAAWGRRRVRYANLVEWIAPLTFDRIRLHDRPTKIERKLVDTLLAGGGVVELVD